MSQQSTASTQDTDDNDDDADNDTDGDDSQDNDRQEAIKRRLQNKKLRKENERLRAQLAQAGEGDPADHSGPDRSDVVLGLVEAGMSKDRVRAAMKLIEWSNVDDVEDAIEELRTDHPFLFEQGSSSSDGPRRNDLPSTGASHRGRRRPSEPSDDELRRKYPSLGR